MRISEKVKVIVPLFLLSGVAPVFAVPLSVPATTQVAQVKVNQAQAEICTRSVPIFGVAFGNNVSPRGELRFGLPVIYVKKSSPAALAGIRVGDILLTLDGQKLFFPSQFAALLRTYEPGDSVEVSFCRGGEIFNSTVELAVRNGRAINRNSGSEAVAPANNDRDDIRIVINGREISLSKNSDLKNRVALTPDGIIIRTRGGELPDELRRIVERFRRVLDVPSQRGFYSRAFEMPVITTSSQVFANNENTVVFTRENEKREVSVRSRKDGEIFRGACATQEEIDAIPEDVLAIIHQMTVLRPLGVSAEKDVESSENCSDKK